MFLLQLGHIKVNQIPPQEFDTVKSVFLRLFIEKDESFYIFWNDIPLRFRYREDLYQDFDDIMSFIWLIHKKEKGETTATFVNQLIEAQVNAYWNEDELKMAGHFSAHETLYQQFGYRF